MPDGGAGLAYKFLSSEPVPATSPWKLIVATETIESWVRAEVVNWITLGESLANGRALVRYEIQNAPVKEFRLKVPASFKNVEITGANIRRRDQNGDRGRKHGDGGCQGCNQPVAPSPEGPPVGRHGRHRGSRIHG